MPANDIALGTWTAATKTFTVLSGAARANANAARVTCLVNTSRSNALKLFFAPIFGVSSSNVSATSIASLTTLNCGPFVGLNFVNISGGSYTNSYNSGSGAYSAGSAGTQGDVCSNGTISLSGGLTVVNGDAHSGIGDTTTMSGGSSVTGSTTPLTTALSEPAVNFGSSATVNNNSHIPLTGKGKAAVDASGNFNLSGGDSVTLPAGTYYFSTLTVRRFDDHG